MHIRDHFCCLIDRGLMGPALEKVCQLISSVHVCARCALRQEPLFVAWKKRHCLVQKCLPMAPFDADNDDKPLDLGLPSLGVNSQWLHKLIIPHWCKKSPNWRWTVFFKESFETAGIHTVQHRHVVYSGFLQRHQWFVLKKIPKASVGKEVTLLTRLRVWFFRHTAFCSNIHQKTNEKEMANNILRGQTSLKMSSSDATLSLCKMFMQSIDILTNATNLWG